MSELDPGPQSGSPNSTVHCGNGFPRFLQQQDKKVVITCKHIGEYSGQVVSVWTSLL